MNEQEFEYDPDVEEVDDVTIRTAKPADRPYTNEDGNQDDVPEEESDGVVTPDESDPAGGVVSPDDSEAVDA